MRQAYRNNGGSIGPIDVQLSSPHVLDMHEIQPIEIEQVNIEMDQPE